MILEGIVTSVAADGEINIAPMGPEVSPSMERLLLKCFLSKFQLTLDRRFLPRAYA